MPNRRNFLTASTTGVLGAAATLSASSSARIQGANNRVGVGLIGAGRQGLGVMRGHMRLDDVDIVAVCDVYGPNLAKAAQAAPKAAQIKDFRQILDRRDIQAVIIGTPDHWHALMTVMACQAGKDVYVEKPTSVSIVEGRKMVEAARKYNRVVQVGTQQRSATHFQRAVELVRAGRIGPITMVRCWNSGNSTPNGIGNPPDGPPPADLDWDLWLGPAPKVAFNPNRFGVVPDAFSHFRWFWDYAGGMMTDWGVHLIDIAQWAMNVEAPLAVSTTGGKFFLKDNRETPDTILATYRYPTFVMTYENRVCNGNALNGHNYGIEFYGNDGTLFVDRAGFDIIPERRPVPGTNGQSDGRQEDRTGGMSLRSTPDNPTHQRNFIDCVKSRKAPICDIEIGHRSSSTAILGNLALRSGAPVEWDGRTETVTNGNKKAADLLMHPYRAPWELKV
jgi:predicted dehydrogenase